MAGGWRCSSGAPRPGKDNAERHRCRRRHILRGDIDACVPQFAKLRVIASREKHVTQALRALRTMMHAAKVDMLHAPRALGEQAHRLDVPREHDAAPLV